MKNISFALLFCLLVFGSSAQSPKGVYNVLSFGAKGDGNTSDTKTINRAIDSAAANGGGQVYFPAGNYLSGSIRLKSNISLYLEQGATIIATDQNPAQEYDAAEQTVNITYQDYGHSHFHDALIWGENLHDVSILGPGMIWGKGLLHDHKGDSPVANKSLVLYKCRNVIVKDVTFKHAGWFAILATEVDNLTIDNVKMDTNRDGMDIDCCRNVHVSNCSVNSPWDDGICLKSSFALGFARATENVTITNCAVSGFDEGSFLAGTYTTADSNAYRTGRIKFGTESNGGFINIAISNCTFDHCQGFALETEDGALLQDVTVSNITMRNIVSAPIFMRLGARMRGPQGTPVGELRRVSISNIRVYNSNPKYGCIISGIPGHYLRDIDLNNIRIYYQGGGTAEQAAKTVPELEKNYPEPSMFGTMPSYGFYIRHVDGIKLRDIEVSYLNADLRPAFIFDDVNGIDMHNMKGQVEKGVQQFKYVKPKQ
ncbi:MAG TPA: glycoside hydrolase family 28 protein [Mucilaginibacter sp.]|nr:glycoside hydrolase family 28 protein [Mucilaginibacter sp.]